ncbi:MAG: hypothetical protein IPL20_03235 [Saprospiraceae bacterium]|nr:hypothetical protein [Saprospiraceae bacterium]
MKRIIISTNYAKLDDILESRNVLNLISINSDFFTGYCEEKEEFVSKKNDAALILIQDNATITQLKDAGLIFNKETDHFLHHKNENALLSYQNILFKYWTDGMHETVHEHKYKPVFEIILDDKDNKAERIIQFLFPQKRKDIQTRLQILHQCLVPSELENIKDVSEEIIKDFESFKTEIEGILNPFDPDYLEKLRTLRDKWLTDELLDVQ